MFQCTVFTHRDIERLVKAINAVATAPIPESEVLIRFRRGWPVLCDEVGRVDIVSGDDSKQEPALDDEVLDDWLDETEEKILEWVAWWGHDQPRGMTDIARSISENHVVTQHYVDRLVRRGFLLEHLKADRPSTYSATPQGRAYLVAERLI